MTLIKFNPHYATSVPSGFNHLVDELLTERKQVSKAEFEFMPKANIIENDEFFEIQLALPGYTKKDIEINIQEGILKIHSEKNDNYAEETGNYKVRQIESGKFSRSFFLPEDVLEEKIKAIFENGILNLRIPKDVTKPLKRSISIN